MNSHVKNSRNIKERRESMKINPVTQSYAKSANAPQQKEQTNKAATLKFKGNEKDLEAKVEILEARVKVLEESLAKIVRSVLDRKKSRVPHDFTEELKRVFWNIIRKHNW